MKYSFLPNTIKKATIRIAFTINDAYVKYFVVCLTSLLESAGSEELHFYVIHDDISEHSKKRILELQSIKNFKMDFLEFDNKALKDIKPQQFEHISIHSSYRLLLATIIPDLDKIIYLDADLVVVKSLKEMWEIDISNYYIASVNDQSALNNSFNDWIPKLKLPNDYRYVNAGITLINLKKWREYDLEKKFLIASNIFYDAIKFPEQDILNIVCAKKNLKISGIWNAMPLQKYMVLTEKEEAFSDPHIIHYAGYNKPWIYPDVPYADLFWKYARKTSYYEELLYGCKNTQQQRTVDDIYWLMHKIRLKNVYYRKFIKYKILVILTLGLIKKYKNLRNENRKKLKYLKKRFGW
ncbi:MAG: glycosyltransferase family 8 protein [Helicobacteraceae bacterium]|jgi:lipopolysaccharide biosynthesis glycosyltransferase|nr:glycosyltransferase family 8 protein [Helicobacteraceae bacterium]